MTLNIDCIRDIIIAISDNIQPDSFGNVDPINPVELAYSNLSNYPSNEVLYWIRQLMDSHIIISGKKYVDEPIPYIKDLSISGYQFINATKPPSIWEKVKPKLLAVSAGSISIFIEKAIELGMGFVP